MALRLICSLSTADSAQFFQKRATYQKHHEEGLRKTEMKRPLNKQNIQAFRNPINSPGLMSPQKYFLFLMKQWLKNQSVYKDKEEEVKLDSRTARSGIKTEKIFKNTQMNIQERI